MALLSQIKKNNLGKFEISTEEDVDLDSCPKCGGSDASSAEVEDIFECTNCKAKFTKMSLGFITYVEEDTIEFKTLDKTIRNGDI